MKRKRKSGRPSPTPLTAPERADRPSIQEGFEAAGDIVSRRLQARPRHPHTPHQAPSRLYATAGLLRHLPRHDPPRPLPLPKRQVPLGQGAGVESILPFPPVGNWHSQLAAAVVGVGGGVRHGRRRAAGLGRWNEKGHAMGDWRVWEGDAVKRGRLVGHVGQERGGGCCGVVLGRSSSSCCRCRAIDADLLCSPSSSFPCCRCPSSSLSPDVSFSAWMALLAREAWPPPRASPIIMDGCPWEGAVWVGGTGRPRRLPRRFLFLLLATRLLLGTGDGKAVLASSCRHRHTQTHKHTDGRKDA